MPVATCSVRLNAALGEEAAASTIQKDIACSSPSQPLVPSQAVRIPRKTVGKLG